MSGTRPWVIDIHNHLGVLTDAARSTQVDPTEVAERVAAMKDRGVDQAIVLAPPAYLRPTACPTRCR